MNDRVDSAELKIHDLLQYIDAALNNVRRGFEVIERQNTTLNSALDKCYDIREKSADARHLLGGRGRELTRKSWELLAEARSHFQSLDESLRRVSAGKEADVQAKEMGLSAVVEDYRSRFVTPCRRHADDLARLAVRLRARFSGVGAGVESSGHALAAANAYLIIVRAIEEARSASGQAMDTIAKAASAAGSDLGPRAEALRVKSEDLFQVSGVSNIVHPRFETYF